MDILEKLKKQGWFLTNECLPIVLSRNDDAEDGLVFCHSDIVEVFHHPELPQFKEHVRCYYDFLDDCWCFDELSGAPMYRPLAWRHIENY